MATPEPSDEINDYIQQIEHLQELLRAAEKQVAYLRQNQSNATTYNSIYWTGDPGGNTKFVFDPEPDGWKEVEPEPDIEFVSVAEQVQSALEKLKDAPFAIPETLIWEDWAEEIAAYVARFYGQPVDRVHVELLCRPLVEYRKTIEAAIVKKVSLLVRNLHFEAEDNLEIAIGIRDQIAEIISRGV
jgi:hypothetical protein